MLSFSQRQGDLYDPEIFHQVIPSSDSKATVCTYSTYFSVPLCPSPPLTSFHTVPTTFKAKSHWLFYTVPKLLSTFFFSPDRSSISHSAFSHCVHNWRQTNLAFTITLSIRLITGLKIENTVDCDGTEPSGWDNHVTGCVMNVLWPTPEDFLI